MSPRQPVTIPARITARDLAAAIDRDLVEVQAVLSARDEPDSPKDVLGSELAVATAKALGVEVSIEPRDMALELLYELETRGESHDNPAGRAGRLVEGITADRDSLDDEIEAASEHWSVARMPLIDRNILRLGLYELRHDSDTPTAVIVSEAVRLAQTYSTERSGSFVNGVLAALARSVRG